MKKKTILSAVLTAWFVLQSIILSYANADELNLTSQEKQFIEEHPIIYMAVDPSFFPYEFIDTDGSYKGIAADYLAIISEKTGIEFVVDPKLTWSQAYEKAVRGELDMLASVLKTPTREEYFTFSDSYYYTYRSIFVSNQNEVITAFSDLENTSVAVQKNSSHHTYLLEYPNIKLSFYETVAEAIKAVSEGKEQAFVGNFATTNYIIKKEGLTNLKSISIDDEVRQTLHFAVRKDYPELISILNKGIASITSEERITINNRWLGVQNQLDYSKIIRIALAVSSVVLLFIAVTLFWTFRLRKEVQRRKIIESDLKIAKEEAELAKEEADMANQIKSTFLARMSHEIRTPLNAITGMSYIMKKTELSTTQQMYLDKISRASKDMLTIINDILDFSKIESGKITLEKISFKIDDILEQLVNIISYKIEEQQIEFAINKDSDIPAFLIGDPNRLEQILLNLVNNAIKFTHEGEVSLSIRQVAKVKGVNHLEFTIKDTGIGMTKEQLDLLFVPFAQADSTINRRFGGTGLGLSIVKNLVEMMEGTVSVYSEAGEGSTFVIQIGFEEDYNKEYEERKSQASVYFKNIRVLVVEKSVVHSNLLREYLKSFNIVAEFVKTDERAMEMIEGAVKRGDHPYNLIVVDYDTPEMNGLTLCKKLKHSEHLGRPEDRPKCLVIFPMSRLELFDEIQQEEGIIGITKPIIPSLLYNGIVELFKVNIMHQQSEIDQKFMHEKANEPHAQNVSLRILVVEDNKTNQFIAKSLLEQVNHQVILTDNGLEGFNYFKDHPKEVDLILMDLHMPVMDGYESTKHIRELDPKIPIIAMTADAITGVEKQCMDVGITSYISKPFDPDMFLGVISRIGEGVNTLLVNSEAINPLNISLGLRSFGGNINLYKQVLTIYLEENKDTDQNIRELVELKEYESASLLVHKLKSSTGTIGASQLYDLCVTYQTQLKNKNETEISETKDIFSEALRTVLEEIHTFLY